MLGDSKYPATLFAAVAAALLGSIQFGYHLGVLNTSLTWVAADLDFQVTTAGAVVVSAVIVGAVFGSLFAGQFADAVGPGAALLLNNLPLLLGSALCADSPWGILGLIAGRFLAGIGAGAASLYVPRYLAEISPVSVRGAIATLNQVFVCVGILLAYLVGLPYTRDEPFAIGIAGFEMAWWRFMLALGLIPASLQAPSCNTFMVGMGFAAESPVWLKSKHRRQEAVWAEKRLLGSAWEAESETNAESIEGTEAAENGEADPTRAALLGWGDQGLRETEPPQKGGWSQLLRRRYWKIMLLTTGLPVLQQGSGVNTVILYSSQTLKEAGLASPVAGSILLGLINVLGTLLAAFLMDRAGRKKLLLLSHCGMAVCLLVLAGTSFVPAAKSAEGIIAFLALFAFVLCFSVGCGPIPWVYLPEILGNSPIKGPAASLGTSLNWLSNLAVGLTFPAMLAALDVGGSYLVYALINVAAAVFVARFMLETKRCSLDAIQRMLLVRD